MSQYYSSEYLKKLHLELQQHAEPAYQKAQQWFFKEGIELIGVRIPIVRKVAAKYWREVKKLEKKAPKSDATPRLGVQLFDLCEELLKTNLQEDSVIALDWMYRARKQLEQKDFAILDRWLKKYVNNWAKCDDLCTGVLGEMIAMYPNLVEKTVAWRTSKNRWVRRGSAVALILPVRKTNILPQVFAAADALLEDEDDLVRKGYGWLLKEASNVYPKEIFAYVMKKKEKMPRVALRYAIEKMPVGWKKQAMKKE